MKLATDAEARVRVKISIKLTQVQSLISFLTNILATRKTRITALAAISNPKDTYTIPYFQRLHRATDLANDANTLVPKHNGVVSATPVIVAHVNVSVAQSVSSCDERGRKRVHIRDKEDRGTGTGTTPSLSLHLHRLTHNV